MAVPVVFTTERSALHQSSALKMAPDALAVTMLRSPGRAELFDALVGARYLLSERRGEVDAALFDAAPDLAMVLRAGSMTHDIDFREAGRRGIVVCQRPQEGVIRVAEHVLMQMLAVLKHLRENEDIAREADDSWAKRRTTDEDTFAYNWSRRTGLQGIQGRTVGILGFGEIGAELARRLAGWGCERLYHRRSRLPDTAEQALGIEYCSQDALLARSDALVCLLPYTDATRASLGRAAFEGMKPGACLISAGSGGVIDEAALARAVTSGHLAGAALDTFAVEPLEAGNPLVVAAREGANVLLTPHVAGVGSDDGWAEIARMYDPILDHLAGRPPSGRLA
jgi:phosphoglycerate dehydrogenase-like enzyme